MLVASGEAAMCRWMTQLAQESGAPWPCLKWASPGSGKVHLGSGLMSIIIWVFLSGIAKGTRYQTGPRLGGEPPDDPSRGSGSRADDVRQGLPKPLRPRREVPSPSGSSEKGRGRARGESDRIRGALRPTRPGGSRVLDTWRAGRLRSEVTGRRPRRHHLGGRRRRGPHPCDRSPRGAGES
ncbi:hypothetical protein NDU88_003245 [Pleurodeles waltl]|uniref:Uncharacterized protein n=1 Tax=Pleurodeles waltl TaxID=8319 RepID=A0AAV7PBJ4_PLEWA|nr:hypothetical protein NDU88_003245 [Pleurodeles waltl]